MNNTLSRLKTLLWIALIAGGVAAAVFLAGQAGNLLASMQRGADPASALNIVPNRPPDYPVRLAWQPDKADTAREMEPLTREQIESAYARAWLQWNLSYARGEPFGLKTYFNGPALAAVSTAVTETARSGQRMYQVNTSHTLQLHFYSPDGQIVSFTDEAAEVTRVVRDAAGAVLFAGEDIARYDVIMLLDDGNWRVHQWVRRGAAAAAPKSVAIPFAAAGGNRLLVGGQPYDLRGINYYPRNTPWDRFWTAYDPAVIDADFALIQTLGLNTIRVFVPFAQFGGAMVSPTLLSRLDDLLTRADAHGLKVIVTLFDFRTDYGLLQWPAADRHLEAIVKPLAGRATILAWDVKNEPDLDYRSGSREEIQLWLRHMTRKVREWAPRQLVTIGFASAASAAELADAVDFVSFHDYDYANLLEAKIAGLRAAAPDKALILGEFGLPTWNSPLFPNGHTEAEQAAYYADVLSVARRTGLAGSLAWTLHDFAVVPPGVAGRWPWQTGPQAQLGVIRPDNGPKPASALLAPGADLAAVPRPSDASRFLKPFWLTVALLALAGAGGAARLARHRRVR